VLNEPPIEKQTTHGILLVGVDPACVTGLRNAVDGTEDEWIISTANAASEALALLENNAFEVVLTRAKLADMDGLELLDAVMTRAPETIRMLLSDYASRETTVRAIGKAHHHLIEPCDPLTVLALLGRIEAFQSGICNPALPALISRLPQLPSPPELYFEVLGELQSGEGSLDRIGSLIAQDPSLTAKVLQLANSAVFGLQLRVDHPVEAVAYLGLETTKALLLLAHSFSYFEKVHSHRFSLPSLQYHSLTVGRYAQRIADVEDSSSEVRSQAFTAGLLHDLGKLLLAANVPEQFDQIWTQCQNERRPVWEVETQLLGANHAEVGGFVLETWHLPAPIVEAVTWHHCPIRSWSSPQSFSPLTAVHAANGLEHELRPEPAEGEPEPLDLDYLKAAGFGDHIDSWRRAAHHVRN
jgi:HD-like signal output (HDOD) protein